VYENTVTALYEACKPEIFQKHDNQRIAAIQYLRGVVDALVEQADIDEISQKISELLDESVVVDDAEAFNIKEHRAEYEIVQKGQGWDLSKINYDKLREDFRKAEYKHIEIAELRAFIEDKLQQLLEQNHTRTDFAQRLQEIIDKYNSGSSSADAYYEDLVQHVGNMREESERHIWLSTVISEDPTGVSGHLPAGCAIARSLHHLSAWTLSSQLAPGR
jgi:type I restriction enzyme R subunit